MKKIIIGICIGVFLVVFYGSLRWYQKSENRSADTLVVGTVSGYAPFVSLNEQNQYEGFDIDVAEELARRIGKKLVLRDLGSMVSLWLALKQNKIDCAIWALSITPERRAEYEMIHYQGGEINALPLIFWKEIPAEITSIEDIQKIPGAIICVEPGSSNEKFLLQYDFLTLKPMEKIVDAILEIKYGKSLATLIDPSLVRQLQQQYPELKVLWVPLNEQWRILGNGIAFNKKKTGLITQIQDVITAMKRDGTIERFEQRWNLKGT